MGLPVDHRHPPAVLKGQQRAAELGVDLFSNASPHYFKRKALRAIEAGQRNSV